MTIEDKIMTTLRDSYKPLEDGSETSNAIVAQLTIMDERKRLVTELMRATSTGDKLRAAEIRAELLKL